MVQEGLLVQKLREKFKGKSLSKTYFEKLAKKWAPKIETDDDIDEYIEDREDVILEAASEADRVRTEAAAAAAKKAAKKTGNEGDDDDEPEEPEFPEGTPDYMKTFMKKVDKLGERMSTFETQSQQKTISERFKAHPDLKGVPEFMFKGRIPTKEEDFDAFVEELKTDFTSYAETHKIPLGGDRPGSGSAANPGSGASGDGKVSDTVKAFAEKLNPPAAAAAK
jgi:hypothetical protein